VPQPVASFPRFFKIAFWILGWFSATGVQNAIKNLAKKYMPKVFARKKIDKKDNADFHPSSWLWFCFQKGTKEI
jgi:hypothetical protein